MIWRAALAALMITAVMVACTVQRVPTECYTTSTTTTIRTKNKAFGYTPTSIVARGVKC